MSDLKKYVEKRKKASEVFEMNYEDGYRQYQLGVMLKLARRSAGLTQAELARRLETKKESISRIENHAEDIKLSTLEKVVAALGKRLMMKIA